jgi:molybdopterin converting factor subunit 1
MRAMKVRLLFFAVLRDIAGSDERELILTDGTTARDVWQSLRAEFAKLADYAEPPMTAINEEYAEPDTTLKHGDELAFIPPVAGG